METKTFASFEELELPQPLLRALARMKFLTPTPVQAETIPIALKGLDVLGTAQTGTGKTGAFGIPVVAALNTRKVKQVLILAPTRELAAQIFKVMRELTSGMNLFGALLTGGESFRRQVMDIRRGADYIIATPGRLIDQIEQGYVKLDSIGIFVLDEVDRMVDMGFAPQIKRILKHVPAKRQTLLFSATLPSSTMGLINSLLTNPVRVSVGTLDKPADRVKQETVKTSSEGKTELVIKEVSERLGRVLIFARTQSRTEKLARDLEKRGLGVVCMHGGLRNNQRKDALRKYHLGSHRIMVATDLAARGIDVADIEKVINFDVPATREDYIHRIGRTGRVGKEGSALTFVTNQDYGVDYILTGKKAPRPGQGGGNGFRPRFRGGRGRR